MEKDKALIDAQPSLKNYATYWLIAVACLALAVLGFVYRKAVMDAVRLSEHPEVMGYAVIVLVAAAIVLVLLIFIKRARLSLRVFNDRVVIERGLLSKNFKELFIADIRTIDINQSIFQRLMGTGDMILSTPGVSQTKDVLRGFPDPGGIKDTMIRLRQQKKQEAKQAAAPETPPKPQDEPQDEAQPEQQ